MSVIPTIDLTDIVSINECVTRGFFYCTVNEQDHKIISDIMSNAREYFDQSSKNKLADSRTPLGLGYSALGKIRRNKPIELKESFSYRSEYSRRVELYEEYMKVLHVYAERIFIKILDSLNISYDKSIISPSFDTLTLIHYPKNINDNMVGINSHTDWGFLTLIITDQTGLQIYDENKKIFIDVPVMKNKFIVNIADMMSRLSKYKLKSTVHRVVLNNEKYTAAFFYEPNKDTCIYGLKFEDYVVSKLKESE